MARRYKQGTARTQQAMLPPRVEDDVGHDNAVRAIDAFVDMLNSNDQLLHDNDAQEGRNGELFADDPKLDEKLEALKERQAQAGATQAPARQRRDATLAHRPRRPLPV